MSTIEQEDYLMGESAARRHTGLPTVTFGRNEPRSITIIEPSRTPQMPGPEVIAQEPLQGRTRVR